MFTPSPYQQAVFDWIEQGSGDAVVNAVAGSGKCLGKDTPVLLFNGHIKPVQDVQVGNLLMGPDSQPRRVLSTCIGHGPLYRIIPIKGMSWICNDAHVLTLAGTNRLKGQIRDIPLNVYLALTTASPAGRIDRQWKLMRVGVDFPDMPVDIDPYLAGLWLGDGTTADVSFTVMNQHILDYLVRVAPNYGAEAVIRDENERGLKHVRLRMGPRGKAGAHTPSWLRDVLLKQFRTNDGIKVIPRDYLINSREKRLHLLAGLIDSDGCYQGGNYEIATKHQHLSTQIAFLAHSLGFAAYISEKYVAGQTSGIMRTYYRVYISGDVVEIPCHIPYKQASKRNQIKDVQVTGWSTEAIGEGAYYGFTLGGDGRFLLGDFTVTHNTTTLLQAATRLQVRHALFVAFNKLIADELSTRLQANSSIMRASTIHSLGKGCIETHLGTKTRVVGNKYLKLCRNYLKARGNAYEGMARNLQKLVSFAQLTLTDPTQANLIQIVNHYDLKDIHVLEDSWSVLWPAVRIILDAGIQQFQHEHVVDFNDMVWLPTACNTSTPQYEFLFVDECQDLNRAQLELILKCRAPGGRLLFVGDRRQSLYGFAGADTESVNNIVKRTQAKELPLSICYRCATSHIELARQVVSEIEPSPYAPEGEVGVVKSATLAQSEPSKENTIAILCRTTAPLVSACLKALQQGKRAIVRGKDIGASIIDILDKLAELKHTSLFRVEDIPSGLDYYRQIQLAALQAKEDNELAIESLYDRCDTVEALYMAYLTTCEEEKATPVMQGLKDFISSKFDDTTSEDTLIFSTVHKAKGLEFDTIYILKSELMPHPAAKSGWQIDQEYNIIYVALTRAKQRLYFLDKAIPWLILPGDITTEEPIALPTDVVPEQREQKEKRGRGRPRKSIEIRDRVNISLDVDVIRFLRSKNNYSELIESLIQALPEFDEFIKQ